jgi:hypothetical protein
MQLRFHSQARCALNVRNQKTGSHHLTIRMKSLEIESFSSSIVVKDLLMVDLFSVNLIYFKIGDAQMEELFCCQISRKIADE